MNRMALDVTPRPHRLGAPLYAGSVLFGEADITGLGDRELVLKDYYGTKALTEADVLALLRDYYDERGWGWWYFSHIERRDEKIVLSTEPGVAPPKIPVGYEKLHEDVKSGDKAVLRPEASLASGTAVRVEAK